MAERVFNPYVQLGAALAVILIVAAVLVVTFVRMRARERRRWRRNGYVDKRPWWAKL